VRGHALTLTLLGSYLCDAHEGDIRKRDLVKLEEADAEEQGGHAFRVMEAYERAFENEGDKGRRALAILRLLGLFDRPMTADCFGALLQPPAISDLTDPLIGITEAQRNIAIKRLEDAKLVTVNRAETLLHPSSFTLPTSIDAHPLLREYSPSNFVSRNPTPGARPTGGSTNTSAPTRRTNRSPRWKTPARSTKPWPTAARRECTKKSDFRSIESEFIEALKSIQFINSERLN